MKKSLFMIKISLFLGLTSFSSLMLTAEYTSQKRQIENLEEQINSNKKQKISQNLAVNSSNFTNHISSLSQITSSSDFCLLDGTVVNYEQMIPQLKSKLEIKKDDDTIKKIILASLNLQELNKRLNFSLHNPKLIIHLLSQLKQDLKRELETVEENFNLFVNHQKELHEIAKERAKQIFEEEQKLLNNLYSTTDNIDTPTASSSTVTFSNNNDVMAKDEINFGTSSQDSSELCPPAVAAKVLFSTAIVKSNEKSNNNNLSSSTVKNLNELENSNLINKIKKPAIKYNDEILNFIREKRKEGLSYKKISDEWNNQHSQQISLSGVRSYCSRNKLSICQNESNDSDTESEYSLIIEPDSIQVTKDLEITASSIDSDFKSVHTSCDQEECDLDKCSVQEIVNLPYGKVEGVRSKLLSCPDFLKHKVDGIPLAAYIFSNVWSGPWPKILAELEQKWGYEIFAYVDGKGNSTLHWLMSAIRGGALSEKLLCHLDPNIKNHEDLAPIQYAFKYLTDNPNINSEIFKYVVQHICIIIAANPKLINIDLDECIKVIDKLPKNRQKGFYSSINKAFEQRQQMLSGINNICQALNEDKVVEIEPVQIDDDVSDSVASSFDSASPIEREIALSMAHSTNEIN